MAGPSILINVGSAVADGVAGIQSITTELEKQKTTGEKWGAALGKASTIAAAGLAAAGVAGLALAKSAADDAAAAQRLEVALVNSAGATDAQVASTEAWISAQGRATGITDDELRPALGLLASEFGSVAQAQQYATLAMDIAAKSGVSVEQAAKAIAKAHDGQYGALRKLVPGIDDAAVATKDFDGAMASAAAQTTDAAAQMAGTDAGKMQILTLTITELGESFGAALLPAISAALVPAQQFADWATKNQSTVTVITGVILGLAASIVVANVALKAYQAATVLVTVAQAAWRAGTIAATYAQWALNVALAANPIGAVVALVIALVAAIVLLWNKNAAFRDFVKGAWSVIENVFTGALSAISSAIGWVIDKMQDLWDWILKIKDNIGGVLSKIPGVGRTAMISVGYATTAGAPTPTATATGGGAASSSSVNVTEEQVYRAVHRLLVRGDIRNGRALLAVP